MKARNNILSGDSNLQKTFRLAGNKGFTLVELLITIAILGALSAIAIPNYLKYIVNAKNAAAVAEVRIIARMIGMYESDTGHLPADLSELRIETVDPWGNPYQYLNIKDMDTKGKDEDKTTGKDKEDKDADAKPDGKSKMRKDHFLVPVNSDYDLYSMGADGKSVAPFTAKASRDDIVRANDGRYVGLASDF